MAEPIEMVFGLRTLVGPNVHCKSGNISETVQDLEPLLLQTTNRKWFVVYPIAPFLMAFNDLQRHLLIASLFKCNILYGYAPVLTISIVIVECGASVIAEPVV